MEDDDQRRIQEMMSQGAGGQGGGAPQENQEQQEAKRRAADERRRSMLSSIMTAEARERLSRIALVKPEKAQAVEGMILAAAQRGQLNEKISDERLMSMLEQINEREGGKTKITIQRRRPLFDDED